MDSANATHRLMSLARCQAINTKVAIAVALIRLKPEDMTGKEFAQFIRLVVVKKQKSLSEQLEIANCRLRTLRREYMNLKYGPIRGDDSQICEQICKFPTNKRPVKITFEDEFPHELEMINRMLYLQTLPHFDIDNQCQMYIKDSVLYILNRLKYYINDFNDNQFPGHHALIMACQIITNTMQCPKLFFIRPHCQDAILNTVCALIQYIVEQDNPSDMYGDMLLIFTTGDHNIYIMVIQCILDCLEQILDMAACWITEGQTYERSILQRSHLIFLTLENILRMGKAQHRDLSRTIQERIQNMSDSALTCVSYFAPGTSAICWKIRAIVDCP
ncbi:hypothetical protein GJ496_005155 [Pomphorhynchus laevis]|nr:hypothetical protein GJ496_005155 [Pomphorhynchus laevis]